MVVGWGLTRKVFLGQTNSTDAFEREAAGTGSTRLAMRCVGTGIAAGIRRQACLGALLGGLVGCLPSNHPPDAQGASADGMTQAAQLLRAARYAEAAAQYRAVLRREPDNALAHCELGFLLQDNQDDPSAALFHLRSYLDLRPESDLAPVVLERIKTARERLARQANGNGTASRSVTDAQIVVHIEELNAQVADRDRTIQQLRDQNAALARDNERLAKEVRSLTNRLNLMLDGMEKATRPSATALRNLTLDDLAASRPAAASGAAPARPARSSDRTYRVRRGDSLWSIAQKVYGDPSRSVDIRNANRRRVGANDRLTEGDELVIPFP